MHWDKKYEKLNLVAYLLSDMYCTMFKVREILRYCISVESLNVQYNGPEGRTQINNRITRRATRGGGQAPPSLIKGGHAPPLRSLAPPLWGGARNDEVHPGLQFSDNPDPEQI